MKYAGLLFVNAACAFVGGFAALRIREKSRVARLLIEMANMMESMLSFGSEDSVKIIRTLSNEKAFAELTFLKNMDIENIAVSTCLNESDNERTALLFKMLGSTDVPSMMKSIEGYKASMELSACKYDEYCKSHAKLFVAFGLLGGLLLTVLTI